MAQDVERNVFHVLGSDIGSADQKRIGAGGQAKVDRRPRRSAILDERLQVVEPIPLGMPGRRHDVQNVILDLVIQVDRGGRLLHAGELRRIEDRLNLAPQPIEGDIDHLALLARAGIARPPP